jgi:2-hydroxychromene-2-carboxylate isomerase
MDVAVVREAARLDAVIEENQNALTKAGHWGVPTMAFKGEPFFGQDRIDLLLWRLKQHGLKEREA